MGQCKQVFFPDQCLMKKSTQLHKQIKAKQQTNITGTVKVNSREENGNKSGSKFASKRKDNDQTLVQQKYFSTVSDSAEQRAPEKIERGKFSWTGCRGYCCGRWGGRSKYCLPPCKIWRQNYPFGER